MSRHHGVLVQEAKDALSKVFSDTSVPQSQTREDLKDIRDEIETMLDSMQGDDT